MKRNPEENSGKNVRARRGNFILRPFLAVTVAAGVIFAAGCTEFQRQTPDPFFAVTEPPPVQEFRWSNGKLPKSFDPATAIAPPETDVARAVFEGLTDIDPQTLEPRAAVAESWEVSEDKKEWTFHLRADAKWSNGDAVTAEDFVRSWKRLASRENVGHESLLKNFANFRPAAETDDASENVEGETVPPANSNTAANTNTPRQNSAPAKPNANTNTAAVRPASSPVPAVPLPGETLMNDEAALPDDPDFGIVAEDEHTLKIKLLNPDEDLPALVAHPIFLPVHESDTGEGGLDINAEVITNGPFAVAEVSAEGVRLQRSETYWSRENVSLDRVVFVPAENAEQALNAYRAGKVDAVTNANFEPLVLKLLAPYDDFRRTRHGAINFYEFNRRNKPFDDRRVREALAIAIERERLTEGELEGTTQPAFGFLPFDESDRTPKIVQDTAKARMLLSDAGFPDGEGFPVIRLVINRNDAQQRVARSVAKMWQQNLNIETEIIVKEPEQLQAVRESGEFDLMRRGAVLPTTDELANFIEIFGIEHVRHETPTPMPAESPSPNANANVDNANIIPNVELRPIVGDGINGDGIILNESDAIYELHGIPLYFSVSYSLVKPYVNGFDLNGLDAPSLKDVNIDSSWRPEDGRAE